MFKGLVYPSKLYDLVILLRLQAFGLYGGHLSCLCLLRDLLLLGVVGCVVKSYFRVLHYLPYLYVCFGGLFQGGIIDRVGIDRARGAGIGRVALTCVSFLAKRHAGRDQERQGQP